MQGSHNGNERRDDELVNPPSPIAEVWNSRLVRPIPWSSDSELVGVAFYHTSGTFGRLATLFSNAFGLSSRQAHVLIEARNYGESGVPQLALREALNADASVVSRSLDALVKKHLITRERSGRPNSVRLTEKGGVREKDVRSAYLESWPRLFTGFSSEEMESFLGMLARLQDNIRDVRVDATFQARLNEASNKYNPRDGRDWETQ